MAFSRTSVPVLVRWSMLGEVIRILVAADSVGRQHYETTLFHQSQAKRGNCTAHSTIYTANVAAGLMVHQLTRWLRDLEPTIDLSLNLLANELSVCDP
jgi:sulfur carrier protein ThiS adenylyltransferase